jgi:SAM-dependent methyltransferase
MEASRMSSGYHESRLEFDPKRQSVWASLWRYHFRHIVPADGCVLDLGCGYGDFINAVEARRRIALDRWDGFAAHLKPGIEPVVAEVTNLNGIEDDSVDFAFASNLFEHISQDDFATTLEALGRKLTDRGSLAILQPNYRYAYREYFDDYTHVSVYSHVSLADFLTAHGWEVTEVRPQFLPLTVKSRLPVFPQLIWLYLNSPFKPLGKQMFLRARPRTRAR